MRLRGFDVSRAQLGWVSDCYVTETTAEQFTDVQLSARCGSYFLVVAMVKSYLAARKLAASQRAKPGERAIKGWCE